MALYSADSLTESEDSFDFIYFLATLCRDSPCLIKMTSIVKSLFERIRINYIRIEFFCHIYSITKVKYLNFIYNRND